MLSMKRSKRRKRSLGAAMVEAGVIMPVMVLFLGFMGFAYNMYSTKLGGMYSNRNAVWGYATNNCGGGPKGQYQDPGDKNGAETEGYAGQIANAISGFFTNFSPVGGTSSNKWTGTARGPYAWQALSVKQLSYESYVYCNNKPFNTGWATMIVAIGAAVAIILPALI